MWAPLWGSNFFHNSFFSTSLCACIELGIEPRVFTMSYMPIPFLFWDWVSLSCSGWSQNSNPQVAAPQVAGIIGHSTTSGFFPPLYKWNHIFNVSGFFCSALCFWDISITDYDITSQIPFRIDMLSDCPSPLHIAFYPG